MISKNIQSYLNTLCIIGLFFVFTPSFSQSQMSVEDTKKEFNFAIVADMEMPYLIYPNSIDGASDLMIASGPLEYYQMIGIQLCYKNIALKLKGFSPDYYGYDAGIYYKYLFLNYGGSYSRKSTYTVNTVGDNSETEKKYDGKPVDISMKYNYGEIGTILSFNFMGFEYLDYYSLYYQNSRQNRPAIGLVCSYNYSSFIVDSDDPIIPDTEWEYYGKLSAYVDYSIIKHSFSLSPTVNLAYDGFFFAFAPKWELYQYYIGKLKSDEGEYNKNRSSSSFNEIFISTGLITNDFFINLNGSLMMINEFKTMENISIQTDMISMEIKTGVYF